MSDTVALHTRLWRWQGGNGGQWFFLSIEGAAAEAIAGHALIRRLESGRGRGFGSVKVEALVGDSRWRTSVFPTKDGAWLLPVKAAIRRAEGITEGDEIPLVLTLD